MNKILQVDNFISVVNFLQSNGFYRTKNNDKSYALIRVSNNIARQVGDFQITDLIKFFLKKNNRLEDFNYFMKSSNKKNLVEALDYYNKPFLKDNKNESFFFFKNTGIVVDKNDLNYVSLEEIKSTIWDNQIIKKEFSPNSQRTDFAQFISDVSGSEKNKESLESAIGYLLTDYKNPVSCPAIIFTDNNNTGQANGGTGKSLIMNAIGQMVNLAQMDGKNINKNFQFSNVDKTTKIIYYDDVESDFDFKKCYSIITGELVVEKKYENRFNISPEESPKLAISSNYDIKSDGGTSDARRRAEFELTDYYKPDYTPEDKFKKRFFIDWDEEEWSSFFMYMLNCQRLYMEKGLITPEIDICKQITKQTSEEFLHFCEENLNKGRNDKSILFNKYRQLDNSISPKKFKQWLDTYCSYKKLKFNHEKSNGNNYITIQ